MAQCGKCGALLDIRPSSVAWLLCEQCARAEAWVLDLRDKGARDQDSQPKEAVEQTEQTVRS